MRHKMRERRKRFARARKVRESWRSILRPGGLIVCSPDVFGALTPEFIADIRRSGASVRSSPHAPRGTVFGIMPQLPIMREPFSAFAFEYEF